MNGAEGEGESLTIRPEPRQWMRWLSTPATDERARRLRRELALPDSDAIVMSGHQAEFWHPGILAKLFAVDAAAAAMPGASGAWVVVDQDDNDPAEIAVPRMGPARGVWRFAPAADGQMPTGGRAALDALAPPPDVPREWGFVHEGLAGIQHAMRSHRDAASLARQVTEAAWSLGLPSVTKFYATALAATAYFRELTDRMRTEPRACVQSYNTAVGADRGASGIRPLVMTRERVELPLWHLRPGLPRRRVYAGELAAIPPEQLAPRALLMTGLLRLGACDLFVHGLGGERYDRVTQRWLEMWLGPGTRLAPTAVVSATRYLPIGATDTPRPREIADATARARRARYQPALLEDDGAASRQSALVAAIAAAPRRGGERARLFRELHDVLHLYRERYARPLSALRERAEALAVAGAGASVAFDRTWAFPLYPRATLDSLREDVARVFAAGGESLLC